MDYIVGKCYPFIVTIAHNPDTGGFMDYADNTSTVLYQGLETLKCIQSDAAGPKFIDQNNWKWLLFRDPEIANGHLRALPSVSLVDDGRAFEYYLAKHGSDVIRSVKECEFIVTGVAAYEAYKAAAQMPAMIALLEDIHKGKIPHYAWVARFGADAPIPSPEIAQYHKDNILSLSGQFAGQIMWFLEKASYSIPEIHPIITRIKGDFVVFPHQVGCVESDIIPGYHRPIHALTNQLKRYVETVVDGGPFEDAHVEPIHEALEMLCDVHYPTFHSSSVEINENDTGYTTVHAKVVLGRRVIHIVLDQY